MNAGLIPTRVFFNSLLLASLITLISGCVTVQTGKALTPSGPYDDGPMVIRKVFPDTPAVSNIDVGDKIIALGNTPIQSIGQYFNLLSNNAYDTFTLEKANGLRKTLAINHLLKPSSYDQYASPLNDGESFVLRQTTADGEPCLAGMFSGGDIFGTISGVFHDKASNVIEIRVTGTVATKCSECYLKNVALMDWKAQSWIQPISTEDAAWLIYPAQNQPGQMVNVPPPIPVSATAFSTTTGTFDAHRAGNYIYGTYRGQTTTTVVPQYNYALTNAALMQNLAVAIQQDNIRHQNKLRQDYVSKRSGNLRFGKLNPGEQILGYLYFSPPKHLTGPYVVFVDGGNRDSVGAVRLDLTGP